jgi:methylmalonyl-CoA/ethylmalonyl-CoA epimerase
MSNAIDRIHHINFLVRDLDAAETRYRDLLGLGPAIRDELPGRKVITARFKLGETWLVLVQPTSDAGEPARYLRERGEGFFLISFGVEDLDAAIQRVEQAGARFTSEEARTGLEGWRIIDIDPADTFGALLQLAED